MLFLSVKLSVNDNVNSKLILIDSYCADYLHVLCSCFLFFSHRKGRDEIYDLKIYKITIWVDKICYKYMIPVLTCKVSIDFINDS